MADSGLAHVKHAVSGTNLPQQDYSFTTKDGITLTYSVAGSGPLVVAQSPGWGLGKAYLERFFAPLTESYTLLCLVSRGTLPSGRPADESKMSTADMAEDLEALRIHLGEEKLTILGHSNGAAIVLSYASKHPSLVEKLILISCQLIGFDDSESFKNFAAIRSRDTRYATALAGFQKAFGATTDDEIRNGLIQIMPYYFADPDKYAKVWQDMIAASVIQVWPYRTQLAADTSSHGKSSLNQGQAMPELEKVTAKTIIFAGDQDAFCSMRTAKRVKEGIPSAKLVVYENCGHMPWEENKDQFFADLFAFLAA